MRFILSLFYSFGVFVRNLLFDEHLLYTWHPDLPTICVGNLAAGGTGKTPHVDYIVSLLLKEGFRVAVLSRGYGRRTNGFILADINSTADTIGDEARQTSKRFPEIPVAVCEDRIRGIRRLHRLFPDLDVIVLDDAFQHRRVRCGYNILLTPADRLYTNDNMLPYGRLREHARGALRADAVCVTKCPDNILPIEQRVIDSTLNLAAFQELYFSWLNYSGEPDGKCYLVAGVAQPHYLLNRLGDKVVDSIIFPDHHRFTQKDIAKIEQLFTGDLPVCTTEKDYVRLLDSPFLTDSLRRRLCLIRISVDFRQFGQLFDMKLLRYVRENSRKPNQ